MNVCVCSVQVPFVRGGAESMVENLLEALRQRGHAVEHVCLPFKWYPKEQIIRDCMAWKLLDISESYFQSVDCVIATKFPAYLVRHPRKIVWLAHQFREVYDCFDTSLSGFDYSEFDTTIRRILFHWDYQAFMESEKTFTISQNVSRRLLQYNGIESRHIYVPPKSIGQYRKPEFEDFIFCPGRLEVSKRLDLLIKAAALVRGKGKFLIAGRGPQRDILEKLALECGVRDKIEFLGFVSDEKLLDLYSRAAAVYFAPFDEDLGLITLEAFRAGKPVITCKDSGAVLEFVEDEINGKIVEPDPEAIAEAMTTLLSDKKKCRTWGEEGKGKIAYIDWQYVLDSLLGE